MRFHVEFTAFAALRVQVEAVADVFGARLAVEGGGQSWQEGQDLTHLRFRERPLERRLNRVS